MRLNKFAIIFVSVSAFFAQGCGDSQSPEYSARSDVRVPQELFVTSAPTNANSLAEAKSSAKQGDDVTFEARIGGRVDPFVVNRAIFFVADSSLLSCDQLHGDTCKSPWDYCCEPPENLRKHMATVQVVDETGQPLKLSLKNEQGLQPLKTVYVSGKVWQIDDVGNFVINAESIHVKGG